MFPGSRTSVVRTLDDAAAAHEGGRRPAASAWRYDAGTLIVIASGSHGTYTEADCWLAAENLMLVACDMGFGSCPIGFAIPLLNTPEAKEELMLPESAVVVAPIYRGPSEDDGASRSPFATQDQRLDAMSPSPSRSATIERSFSFTQGRMPAVAGGEDPFAHYRFVGTHASDEHERPFVASTT